MSQQTKTLIPRPLWEALEAGKPWAELRTQYRPTAQKHSAHFHSQIRGIPCGVKVLHYHHEEPDTWEEPGWGSEFEAHLLRPSGSVNSWLEQVATPADWHRLELEWEAVLAERQTEIELSRRGLA